MSPGLLQGFFYHGGPHTAGASGTLYPCAASTREARVSSPGVCSTCVCPSHVVYCAWPKTSVLSPPYCGLRMLGTASPIVADCQGGVVSPMRHPCLQLRHGQTHRLVP